MVWMFQIPLNANKNSHEMQGENYIRLPKIYNKYLSHLGNIAQIYVSAHVYIHVRILV